MSGCVGHDGSVDGRCVGETAPTSVYRHGKSQVTVESLALVCAEGNFASEKLAQILDVALLLAREPASDATR